MLQFSCYVANIQRCAFCIYVLVEYADLKSLCDGFLNIVINLYLKEQSNILKFQVKAWISVLVWWISEASRGSIKVSVYSTLSKLSPIQYKWYKMIICRLSYEPLSLRCWSILQAVVNLAGVNQSTDQSGGPMTCPGQMLDQMWEQMQRKKL